MKNKFHTKILRNWQLTKHTLIKLSSQFFSNECVYMKWNLLVCFLSFSLSLFEIVDGILSNWISQFLLFVVEIVVIILWIVLRTFLWLLHKNTSGYAFLQFKTYLLSFLSGDLEFNMILLTQSSIAKDLAT